MIGQILIAALLLLAALGLRAGQVLDRMVATVNHQVILQSDVEDELRYEMFLAGRPPHDVSSHERNAVLDRLIDRELLREQIRNGEPKASDTEQIEKQIETLKADYAKPSAGVPSANDGSVKSWEAALSNYWITEEGLRSRLLRELQQLQFVDARLRPSIQIDAAAVEKYYQDQLLPQLLASGAQRVSLAEGAPKIRELLTQQKMNQLLISWLETLRTQAEITITPPYSLDAAGPPQ